MWKRNSIVVNLSIKVLIIQEIILSFNNNELEN